jgi:DNA repair protein RadD
MGLYDYQQIGVDCIRDAYKEDKRAPLYVLPTGGGKTVVFCHIAENAQKKGKRVWILVHRVELLRQTSKKLTENGVKHGLISPKFTPDLLSIVQVAGVQTVVNRLGKFPAPDLIIIDECHHATAGSWRKIIDYFPNAKILGVTATPCRADGTGLNHIFDEIIIGPQIYELIDQGKLVKPVVYAPQNKMNFSSVKITRGDFDKDEISEIVDRPTITGDVVKHYMKIADGIPAVVFCISIKHAQHVADEFKKQGYRAHSVDGSMHDDLRKKMLAGLGNGTVDVITSCDLISEGTDIPAIGCIISLRPTTSLSLYIQQLGRGLRLSDNKTKAIILDHVGNTFIHGMVDSHREWSLEGKKKKSKKKDDEPDIKISQCMSCFAVYSPNQTNTCPACGFINEPPKIREIEHIDGELQMITELNAEKQSQLKFERQNEIRNAKTFADLLSLERKYNYKSGWAFHLNRLRNTKMKKS